VSVLSEVIDDLDLVLVMSVNPGFGGQKFIENTYKKIKELRIMSANRNPNLLIEIDGGVNHSNALALLQAGADVLVAGNAIFSSSDQEKAIDELKLLAPDNIKV
jgi:ribulose-phosphate 3-epimerase